MTLRSKLVLSIVAVTVAVIVLIKLVWLPSYLEQERAIYHQQAQSELTVLANAIEGDLLSNDLSSIYNILDEAQASHSHWKGLVIHSAKGIRLYPLDQVELDESRLSHLVLPITYEGESLGDISLWVNVEGMMSSRLENINYLLWLIVLLAVVVVIFAYVLMELWIIGRLNKLGEYSKSIADGNYAQAPFSDSSDEIGQLGKLFQFMGSEVERRETTMRLDREFDDLIMAIQGQFISDTDKRFVFKDLLKRIIKLTGSEYGFIGEVLRDDQGQPFMRTFALTNIAWDEETYHMFEKTDGYQMEFRNLDTLFGEAMKTGKTVVSSDPANDPRSGGLPEGHPPLNSFMGMPIYNGGEMVGLLGLANWQGDHKELMNFKKGITLLSSLGSLIVAYRSREAVIENEQRFRSLIDTAVDSIISIDDKGLIKVFNLAAERMFGYAFEEVKGKNISMLMPDSFAMHHDDYIKRNLGSDRSRILGMERELEGLRKNGSRFPMELAVARMNTSHGTEFTAMIRDISERKRAEEKLKAAYQDLEMTNQSLDLLSRKDGLTGIYNRRHFDEILHTELSRAVRQGTLLSVILVDIDFFKLFNDTYGHQAGDRCLQAVAQVMDGTFARTEDMVARYGGEEFAIVVPGVEREAVCALAERLRQNVADTKIPHASSQVAEHVTLSVGVATLVPTRETTPDMVLGVADKALYEAKESGRNNVQCSVG